MLSTKKKNYKAQAIKTDAPQNPHQIHLKYKFRLSNVHARPCPPRPPPHLPPFRFFLGASLPSTRFTNLQKTRGWTKLKREKKSEKKMPVASHTSCWCHQLLSTPAVLLTPTPVTCGVVVLWMECLLKAHYLSIQIAKWWIATLVFVHCARGMMLMQNIQKKYFVMDNTKKKLQKKNSTKWGTGFWEVGAGTYPGPTPTTYPARHLPPTPPWPLWPTLP